MKKRLAYFLACPDNLAFTAGNIAIALNKHSKNKEFDIVIYSDGFQDNNKIALSKIKNVILRKYCSRHTFKSFSLLKYHTLCSGDDWETTEFISFSIFEIFNLLKEYETVVWLSIDMSIQADISELENYGPLGMPKDLKGNSFFTVGDNFSSPIPGYNMNLPSDSTACVVVNDRLENYDKLAKYCYETAIKYAGKLKNIDQAVFQMMLQDFNFVPKQIPWNDYCCHASHELAAIAKMVHFGSEQKIWNNESYLRCFPEWFRLHLEWLSLGGMDFDRSGYSLKSIWYDTYGMGKPPERSLPPETNLPLENFKTRFTLFQIPIFVMTERKDDFSLKVFGVSLTRKSNSIEKTHKNLMRKFQFTSKHEPNGKVSFYLFGIKFCSLHKYKVHD